MHITVTSDVLEHQYDGCSVDSRFIREYLENADNLLVPGVNTWDNVTVRMPDPNTVVIEADLNADDVVRGGEYKGQEVSQNWISGYIEGADAYWLAPGVLKATDISFS